MDQLTLGMEMEVIGDIERALRADGSTLVIGVDEVGRGPLAGPVTAAAVLMTLTDLTWCDGLDDSKKLSGARRRALVPVIEANVIAVEIEHAPPSEVDTRNVLWASMAAMGRAVGRIAEAHELVGVTVLVDGNRQIPDLPHLQRAITKGDGRCYSIAAASIVAKEVRDAMMVAYDTTYPGYGFARHKGYPTKEHLAALGALGVTEIHRRSFAPVKAVLANPPAPSEIRKEKDPGNIE